MTRRLLISIDATPDCRQAIDHLLALHAGGETVEAVLLHVAEPVTAWQVLSHRTPEEVARFQAERGHWLLEDAAAELAGAGIANESLFVRGATATEIPAAARAHHCDAVLRGKKEQALH